MNVAVRNHPAAACQGKTQYESKASAMKIMRCVSTRKGVALRVYRCPFCSSYHLGHQFMRSKA